MKPSELQLQLGRIILGQETVDSFMPEGKIETGEQIIGVVEDPVSRSLYSLTARLSQYLEDYAAAHAPTRDTEQSETETTKHVAHVVAITAIAKVAGLIFWTRVREQFQELNSRKVTGGIREGWQVVLWKREVSETPNFVAVLDLRELATSVESEKKD